MNELRFQDGTDEIIGAAFEVANTLGAGFLEKVYEGALLAELRLRGVKAAQQVLYPVTYKGQQIGKYFADLVVEDRVIVELKCAESLAPEHMGQCINQLKVSGLKVALLINFRRTKIEWKRIVL
ncbi:MAG: GxxExxY protein [Bryobacteraceae bacterium]